MFGWLGIVCLVLFWVVLRKLVWINLHYEESLALPCIAKFSFWYMIISRGYLSQQLLLYIFSITPIDLIYFLNSRKVKFS